MLHLFLLGKIDICSVHYCIKDLEKFGKKRTEDHSLEAIDQAALKADGKDPTERNSFQIPREGRTPERTSF